MKKLILFLLVLPISLFSQEESSFKPQASRNSLVDELNSMYSATDIFNLHPDVLEAGQGVKHLLPAAKILFRDTRLLPVVSEDFARSALKYKNDLTTLTHFGFRMTGNIAGGFGPPLSGVPPTEIFIQSPEQLNDYLLWLNDEVDFRFMNDAGRENWEKLPFDFQSALVKFLVAVTKVEPVLADFASTQKALFSLDENAEDVYKNLIEPWQKRQLTNFSVIESLQKVDLTKLAFATRILNENLRSFFRYSGNSDSFQSFEIETKYGMIGIFDNQKDTISKDYFISVDFGGDDFYTNNCGSILPMKNQVGLLVDFFGDDIYETDFINAGILGVSFLIDLNGNDEYKNSEPGLAFSLFGASVLVDSNGNDLYVSAKNFSQGSAIAGVSIFIDQKGADRYFCRNYSQGYGGTLGCGILIDAMGDDIFKGALPDESLTDYASFIQGASRGRWAEATDGQSLAGGFGIFTDGEGKDTCFAGSFSQGAGYYFGIGMFNDNSGDDVYNAISHSQGYGAHFSLGSFCELKGDDTYNFQTDKTKITQITGGGRDNSCGLFSDKTGNDTYYFGNRSAGTGDMRGMGCFFDGSGENSFYWIGNSIYSGSPSLGKAVDLMNPANEFRLFTDNLNWNSGIFISNYGTNKFYKVIDDEVIECQFYKDFVSDPVLRVSQVFLSDK